MCLCFAESWKALHTSRAHPLTRSPYKLFLWHSHLRWNIQRTISSCWDICLSSRSRQASGLALPFSSQAYRTAYYDSANPNITHRSRLWYRKEYLTLVIFWVSSNMALVTISSSSRFGSLGYRLQCWADLTPATTSAYPSIPFISCPVKSTLSRLSRSRKLHRNKKHYPSRHLSLLGCLHSTA